MPVMDEFKEEREALKHGTPKQKLTYFLDYYKWPTLAVVVGVILVITFVTQIVTSKDTAFYAAFISGTELEPAARYNQAFAEYADINLSKNDTIFDSTMHISAGSPDQITIASSQRLMVYIASSEIDVLVMDPPTMEHYALTEIFHDLREFLTQEQLAAYSPYFYYVDQAIIDRQSEDKNYVYDGPKQDHRDPDTMENPIPVGIYLDNAAALREAYYFNSSDIIIGFVVNSTRPEASLKYLDYLFGPE